MKRRRSFTLMEALISLFLLGVLLFVLFTPLKNYIQDKLQIDALKLRVEERQRLHLRLSHLFQLPTGGSVTCQDGALKITVQKRLDPDPRLSGIYRAEIKLTPGKELVLLLTPEHREILMDGVEKLEWRFFVKSGWKSECPREKPLLVELTLTKKKERATFIYRL